MTDQISEKCKELIRKIEERIRKSLYAQTGSRAGLDQTFSVVFEFFKNPPHDLDEECRRLIKTIEPTVTHLQSIGIVPRIATYSQKFDILHQWMYALRAKYKS